MVIMNSLTTTECLTLSSLVLASAVILYNSVLQSEPLISSIGISGLAFTLTYSMIRWLGPTFMSAGLKGKDLSKPTKKEIPETMGAVCAVVYLVAMILFIPLPFYRDIVAATSGGGNRDVVFDTEEVQSWQRVEMGRLLHRFPHSKLGLYLSGILSLQSVVILGIGDDLFDIRWRHKIFIPAIAAIPILVVYFVDFGVTQVVVPRPLQPYIGHLVDLGWLYYAYMAAISIFCPNSINILAGINGIEVSQSIIIAILILINDSLYILPGSEYPHPATDSHLFSIFFLLPFIGVSLALWWHNWYPARVFVGDTYCYFAGMVFAIVGILGHFSKTLLLLFIPQIFNFVYSAPQLFHVIPCPRHRLPRYNARTNLLEPSVTLWEKPPKTPIAAVLKFISRLGLLKIEYSAKGEIVETSNLTILNLWLVWFGPMREDRLAMSILAMQALVGLGGLFARHKLALWIFQQDNRAFSILS